jgi:hypothetical protein
VSQFEIFAAVRRRPSRFKVSASDGLEAVVLSRKAAPRTRYGPFQNVPRRVDVAVDLDSRNTRIFRIQTDRSFGTVPPHSEQSCEVFLASMTANQPPALAAL